MNVALQKPWTQDRFFAWAEAQEQRYEFDGFEPVAMIGGTANHSRIAGNIYWFLRTRLQGTSCHAWGADSGIQTIGQAIRYPDALVTNSPVDGQSRIIPNPIVVFEVISPSSVRIDHSIKLREYAAVPSILRYVVVESAAIGLNVHTRPGPGVAWTTTTLIENETLPLPEIGTELTVAEIYRDISFQPL